MHPWRHPTSIAAILATLLALALARPAAAEPTPLSLEAAVGVATPVGVAGLNAEYRLTRRVSIEVGGGIGMAGPQASLLPRVRWQLGRTELAVGAGISGGRWEEGGDVPWTDDAYSWDLAVWGNGELSAGVWLGRHLRLRLFAGASGLLSRTPDQCARDGEPFDCASASPDLAVLPYGGAGIAYRL